MPGEDSIFGGGWGPQPQKKPASPPPERDSIFGYHGLSAQELVKPWRAKQAQKAVFDRSPEQSPLGRDSRTEKFDDQLDILGQGPSQGQQLATDLSQQNQFQAGPKNTANQYFQQYQQQIGQDPGLGAYYDRAGERTAAAMNNQLAARGQYGSSMGISQLGDALGGLEAERANREADYMMRQQQLGGQLAGQAGQSMLGWTQGLGGMGLNADNQDLGRLQLALQSAQAGDAGMLNRLNTGFNQTMGVTQQGMGALGGIQGQMSQIDMQLLDAILSGQLSAGAQQIGFEEGNAGDYRSGLGAGAAAIGGALGGPVGAAAAPWGSPQQQPQQGGAAGAFQAIGQRY